MDRVTDLVRGWVRDLVPSYWHHGEGNNLTVVAQWLVFEG